MTNFAPLILYPGRSEVARLVFRGPSDSEGLLDVPPEDCSLIVSVLDTFDGRYILTAEAVENHSGSSDGWYSFLEGFAYGEDAFAKIGEDVPACAAWLAADGLFRWHFDTAVDAVYWGVRFAVDGLSATRR